MKICIIGAGYVGLSLAVILSTKYQVKLLEINQSKVDLINKKVSPITDEYISKYLFEKELNLQTFSEPKKSLEGADLVLIATPTNYDPDLNFFNVDSVDLAIKESLELAPSAQIVVKSTLPVGYISETSNKLGISNLHFLLSFLGKEKHFMITFILQELLLVLIIKNLVNNILIY